jgi:hypothetical protein
MRSILSLLLLAAPALGQRAPLDATNPGSPPPGGRGAGTLALGLSSGGVDDFDRPDGSDLGSAWVEEAGDLHLLEQRGIGTHLGGVAWMRHQSASMAYTEAVQEIDFLPQAAGSDVLFVALVAGIGPTGDSLFVKVQDNTADGIYDTVFFYRGINGGSWGGSPSFGHLAVPTASGRMRVSFTPDGDGVLCEIDRDHDGVYDELLTTGGILSSGLQLGTGFGVSTYDDARFDDWVVRGREPGTAYCHGVVGACPCGNAGGSQAGCANSQGLGAVLSASGEASVGADTVVLSVAGAPPATPGLFFGAAQAASEVGGPFLFGDGLRCASGSVVRLGVTFTDAAGSAGTSGSLSVLEGLAPGVTRHYQFWYRDPAGPCGQGFNTSNAYAIAW